MRNGYGGDHLVVAFRHRGFVFVLQLYGGYFIILRYSARETLRSFIVGLTTKWRIVRLSFRSTSVFHLWRMRIFRSVIPGRVPIYEEGTWQGTH